MPINGKAKVFTEFIIASHIIKYMVEQQQLVCAQCQGRNFIEDGFAMVCQCCGLQVERQATRYEDDDQAGAQPSASALGFGGGKHAGTRKRGTIKEHEKASKRRAAAAAAVAEEDKEDWSDYLLAYQRILRVNGEAAKKCFAVDRPDVFEGELKKVWFQYLDKWRGSGVRLQGGIMEARKGCFKMSQPAKLSKRYFINKTNVEGMSEDAIRCENSETYQSIYAKEYGQLKADFYKRKSASRRAKSQTHSLREGDENAEKPQKLS